MPHTVLKRSNSSERLASRRRSRRRPRRQTLSGSEHPFRESAVSAHRSVRLRSPSVHSSSSSSHTARETSNNNNRGGVCRRRLCYPLVVQRRGVCRKTHAVDRVERRNPPGGRERKCRQSCPSPRRCAERRSGYRRVDAGRAAAFQTRRADERGMMVFRSSRDRREGRMG